MSEGMAETGQRSCVEGCPGTLLEAIIAGFPTGVVAVDVEERVVAFNTEAQKLRRCPASRVLGRKLAECAPVCAAERALIEEVLEKREARLGREYRVEDEAGGLRTYVAHAAPLRDATGDVCGAMALFADVTDERALQERMHQAEKLAMAGELAAGTAHEIRNPLTAIRGFMQLLRVELAGTKREEYLEVMGGELDRIERIINEFLVLAKPSRPNFQRCHVHEILDELCELARSEALLRDVQMTKRFGAGVPELMLDRDHMKQVFLNLIANAIQAMPNGGRLHIGTGYMPGRRAVVVCFRDTGVGIPREDLDKIFQPFFTTKDRGTGLGLTISYRIVQNHRGNIRVHSVAGRGSTFIVELPAA